MVDPEDFRVDLTLAIPPALRPAGTLTTAYLCHACERKTLPDDFVTGIDDDERRCPRCGEPVDWSRIPPGYHDDGEIDK